MQVTATAYSDGSRTHFNVLGLGVLSVPTKDTDKAALYRTIGEWIVQGVPGSSNAVIIAITDETITFEVYCSYDSMENWSNL